MKQVRQFLVLLLCMGTFVISGCYYDNEEELYQYYNEQNQCVTDSLTYAAHIASIISAHCATSGCHVAGGTGNGIFQNYAAVKAKVDNGSLRERVVVRKDMPPSGPLNSCQIQQIDAWITAGAPEN